MLDGVIIEQDTDLATNEFTRLLEYFTRQHPKCLWFKDSRGKAVNGVIFDLMNIILH